jgi:outer membrane protein assembly factor BamB
VKYPSPVKQQLWCLMTVFGLALAGGCAQHKKPTPVEGPVAVPSNSFVRQWANDLKLTNDAISEVHLRDDTVYLYTKNHLVYAMGRTGGELKYLAKPEISGGVLRPPLVLGDHIVYPSGSTIDVFNNVGKQLRTIELDKPTRGGAAGTGNTIYIGLDHTAGKGVVASINITKQYKVTNWELMTFGAVTPTPALYDKVIYAGSEDGKLYAVSEDRGGLWPLEGGTFSTQGKFVSDIKADDFGLYAANTDSQLYCLDRTTGKIKWRYYAGVALATSPIVTATTVYQYVEGTGIVAIDKTSGTFNRGIKWAVKNAVQYLSEDDAHVYVRRNDNRILAVDKKDGQVVFTSKKHPFEVFSTNTKDAMIFAAAPDGRISAIRPVLKEGEVGNLVLDLRLEPVALAQ